MKKKDRIDPKRTAAEVLNAQLPKLGKDGNFFIQVLTGDPAVHDRFLVVDDSVWFSGNSLHTIGDRAGMVVKLRNSADIIRNLTEILDGDRTVTWQDWMTSREGAIRSAPGKRTGWPKIGLAVGLATVGLWWALGPNMRRKS